MDLKAEKPSVNADFPRVVYALVGKRTVANIQALADLVAADGAGVWFDSPDKVPAPAVKPAIDWQAKYDESQAELAELRKVNQDLVAKLMAKPEAKPDAKVEAKK